jgi:endonuclease III
VDQVVATVLSQHTSDVNSARAFDALKARWTSWDAVLDAPTDEVAAAIRSGGLAEIKAPRIKSILAEIERREGRVDLRRLEHLQDREVDQYLQSLPGVGPKTAACVLLFSMRRPAFPVDTHVHRVTVRLGLIPSRTTADQAHDLLTPAIPPELRYEFHVQLIRHGRTVCKAGVPVCSECVLFDLCPAGPGLLAEGVAR